MWYVVTLAQNKLFKSGNFFNKLFEFENSNKEVSKLDFFLTSLCFKHVPGEYCIVFQHEKW